MSNYSTGTMDWGVTTPEPEPDPNPEPDPKYYAGIGSRSTPHEVQQLMSDVAIELGHQGWTLRSGGAKGADFAFAWGADLAPAPKEVYLPAPGWRNQTGDETFTFSKEAEAISKKAWNTYADREGVPRWAKLRPFTQKLMARNACQVAGLSGNRMSSFVICWTPDGVYEGNKTTRSTGGTGHAIRIASAKGVPVFNLYHDDHRDRVATLI